MQRKEYISKYEKLWDIYEGPADGKTLKGFTPAEHAYQLRCLLSEYCGLGKYSSFRLIKKKSQLAMEKIAKYWKKCEGDYLKLLLLHIRNNIDFSKLDPELSDLFQAVKNKSGVDVYENNFDFDTIEAAYSLKLLGSDKFFEFFIYLNYDDSEKLKDTLEVLVSLAKNSKNKIIKNTMINLLELALEIKNYYVALHLFSNLIDVYETSDDFYFVPRFTDSSRDCLDPSCIMRFYLENCDNDSWLSVEGKFIKYFNPDFDKIFHYAVENGKPSEALALLKTKKIDIQKFWILQNNTLSVSPLQAVIKYASQCFDEGKVYPIPFGNWRHGFLLSYLDLIKYMVTNPCYNQFDSRGKGVLHFDMRDIRTLKLKIMSYENEEHALGKMEEIESILQKQTVKYNVLTFFLAKNDKGTTSIPHLPDELRLEIANLAIRGVFTK